MKLIVAKNAGFCFGVDKAVSMVENLSDTLGEHIYTLGYIIHNSRVIEKFEKKGVRVVNRPTDVTEPGVLVIRAHGAPPQLIESFGDSGVVIYDATCPYVKKIHSLVAAKRKDGFTIIIIGDRSHPEIIGINGWCGGAGHIVNSEEDVDSLDLDPKETGKLCVVSQTTISEEFWKSMTARLKRRFPGVELHRTICNATAERQKEAVEIAKKSDMMFVIGEKSSSNACKLYEICVKYCKKTFLVGNEGELPVINESETAVVGITAGASVPDEIIRNVIEKLKTVYNADFPENISS